MLDKKKRDSVFFAVTMTIAWFLLLVGLQVFFKWGYPQTASAKEVLTDKTVMHNISTAAQAYWSLVGGK